MISRGIARLADKGVIYQGRALSSIPRASSLRPSELPPPVPAVLPANTRAVLEVRRRLSRFMHTMPDISLHTANTQPVSLCGRSFACVDCRETRPILGTPAGDFGEFLQPLAYLQQNHALELASVSRLFRLFVDEHCSPTRPFYMHSDDRNLNEILQKAEAKELPQEFTNDLDGMERERWMSLLTSPTLQGCGHLRALYTKLDSYGTDPRLVESLQRAFFDCFFDSKYRDLVNFRILKGSQSPCSVLSYMAVPPIPATPNLPASNVMRFVYHGRAVHEWRKTLVGFFADALGGVDKDHMLSWISETQEKQLKATLAALANGLPVDEV